MAVTGSGTISLSDIQTEFGGSNPIGMNEYYKDGAYVTDNNAGIPTSGGVDMADFYGTELLQPYQTRDLLGDGSGKFLYTLANTPTEANGGGTLVAFAGSGSFGYSTDTPSSKISHSFNHLTNGRSLRTTASGAGNGDRTFTLSMWIKTAGTNPDSFTICQFDNGSNNHNHNYFGKANHGNNVGVFPRNSSGGAGFRMMSTGATNNLCNNTWQHWMITTNNSSSSTHFYIDNVLQGGTTTREGYTTGPETKQAFIIGARVDGNSSARRNFKICQVRCFNKVLSSSERSTVYNELL